MNEAFKSGFRQLSTEIHANAKLKGFWEGRTVGESIALCHSELSEALEYFRHDDPKDDKLTHRNGGEVELADTVIRIMDLAEFLNYDLVVAILEKHEFNKSRPYKHGKKF